MGLLIATPLMDMTSLEIKLELMGTFLERGDWIGARKIAREIVDQFDTEDR